MLDVPDKMVSERREEPPCVEFIITSVPYTLNYYR